MKDKKVDEYISNAAAFAKPILKHWRELLHKTCPDIEESIRWSYPHFDFKGDMMCVMAAYTKHCSFTFLKAGIMTNPLLKDNNKLKPTQRFLGKISSSAELPTDAVFLKLLKEAIELNSKGVKIKREKTEAPKAIEVPDYFAKQLKANPKAKKIFEEKSPSFRKNYLVWITGAKTDETRDKRVTQSLEWISEGKDRFWEFKK